MEQYNNILYQIKNLEKMIGRLILKDEKITLKVKKTRPTPVQIQILHYLLEHRDQGVCQKELESVLKLRRATVSGILNTMEKNELIIRKVNSEDKRTKKIVLNDKAKAIFDYGKNQIEEIEKQLIKDISEEDMNTFHRVINMMEENIEKNISKKDNISNDS